jgi:hypothetical protein
MNLPFRSYLLTVATLVVLNDCSTTGSRPDRGTYPSVDPSTQAGTHDIAVPGRAPDIRHEPGHINLEVIGEMSQTISDYQAERVLEVLRALE